MAFAMHRKEKETAIMISDRNVTVSGIRESMPDGCRLARIYEVAKSFRNDDDFRRMANTRVGMEYWVADIGTRDMGHHEISKDGELISISESRFKELTFERRAHVYPGKGHVVVRFFDFYFGEQARGLFVDAFASNYHGPTYRAGMLYVEDRGTAAKNPEVFARKDLRQELRA